MTKFTICPGCDTEVEVDKLHQCHKNLQDVLKTSIQNTHSKNVGNSDYAKHKIQPWHIWLEYDMNGWDCDIIKRVLRTKEDAGMSPKEQRILDYEKIIHNCEERIRQLEANNE